MSYKMGVKMTVLAYVWEISTNYQYELIQIYVKK